MNETEILLRNRNFSDVYHQKTGLSNLPPLVFKIIEGKEIHTIADFGCGDGVNIIPLAKRYPSKNFIGVDISKRRIDDLINKLPKHKFIVGNVSATNIKSESIDFLICTQVIEHVPDDLKLVDELYRVVKSKGYLFISSVIKKPWAIYRYRNNGRFVLDPTHVREYPSKEAFLSILKDKFSLMDFKVYPTRRRKLITFQIPGYYQIETLWRKK